MYDTVPLIGQRDGGVLLETLPLEGGAQGTHIVFLVFLLFYKLQENLSWKKQDG